MLFRRRQFEPIVIVTAVRWYLRFSLSLRDVEEVMAERGLFVDHTTVWRWVQAYAPEIRRRLRGQLKYKLATWFMDETYVRVAGRWMYLFRAVDNRGQTVDFYLKRGITNPQSAFCKPRSPTRTTVHRTFSPLTETGAIQPRSATSKPMG